MTTVVVDANVWISALIESEEQYLISRAWIDRWQQEENAFVGPVTFLVEVGSVIGRKVRHAALATPTIADIIEDAAFELVPIDQALAERAAAAGIIAELRGADALYVAVAQERGLPLVTWDKDLLDRAGRAGVTARIPTA